MAVTVAVFFFAAQILGAGATAEEPASVNFASEHIFPGVELLSRHVLSVSKAAHATLLANMGKESRRLSAATNYCAWSKTKCMQNDAWATAQLSTVTNPMIKSMAKRATRCATFLTQTACQEGSCKWEGGVCLIAMTSADEKAVMGTSKADYWTGCGWIGRLETSKGKCSSAGACNVADKCQKTSKMLPSDDGKQCIAKDTCEGNEEMSHDAMCPGVAKAAMETNCLAEGQAASKTDVTVISQAMLACMSRKCPVMGTMMKASSGPQAACKALTNSTCSSNSKCKVTQDTGKSLCDLNSAKMTLSLLPAGCPMKGIMSLNAKCGQIAVKATCDKESACLWDKRKECSEKGALDTKEECRASPMAITSAMATITDNMDVKLFAALAQQQAQCLAMKTEEACTPSKVVTFVMTLKHIDFDKVQANSTVKTKLVDGIKRAFLSRLAGYTMKDLTVELAKGSIVATVKITPKAGSDSATLKSTVKTEKSNLVAASVSNVKAVSGVNKFLAAGKSLTDIEATATDPVEVTVRTTTRAPTSISSAAAAAMVAKVIVVFGLLTLASF